MVNTTLKTVYCSFHDGQKFGETPIVEMKIHMQMYITHKQLIDLKHKTENFLKQELENINHKPEYSGSWPNG